MKDPDSFLGEQENKQSHINASNVGRRFTSQLGGSLGHK